MKQLSCTVLLLAAASMADAEERTWTSSDGKYTTQAELVAVERGRVRLRKVDNKLISVPLARLNQADQEFVKAWQVRKAAGKLRPGDVSDILESLKIKAEAKWDDVPVNAADRRRPDLLADILLSGKPAVEASQFGHVQVKTARDDRGKPLKPKPPEFSPANPYEEFVKVDRQDFFLRHPEDGLRVRLQFEHPAEPLGKIALLEGTLKLKTGGTRVPVVVENVTQQKGKVVDHATLKTARLRLHVEMENEATVAATIEGEQDAIAGIELTDARGVKLNTGQGMSSTLGKTTYELLCDNRVPADARLKIELVLDPKEVEVPFRFKDIDVPPSAIGTGLGPTEERGTGERTDLGAALDETLRWMAENEGIEVRVLGLNEEENRRLQGRPGPGLFPIQETENMREK